MTSEKQIAANRKNAKRSTGPRSASGKAAASQNATKHGLTARRMVLQTEDRSEFESLAQRLHDELGPEGPLEEIIVDRIVTSTWRLLRAERIESGVFAFADTALGESINKALGGDGSTTLSTAFANQAHEFVNLNRYETSHERALYRAIAELTKLQEARGGGAFGGSGMPERPPIGPVNSPMESEPEKVAA